MYCRNVNKHTANATMFVAVVICIVTIVSVVHAETITIEPSKIIAVTSENYLGVNIDAASLYQKTRLDLTDPTLRKLACKLSKRLNDDKLSNLGRMTLRIGGSAADDLSTFSNNSTHGHIYLSEAYWDELLEFAEECKFNVAWDLNMRIGRHSNGNNLWDPQDTLRLLEHMKEKNQNVWAFQLGNEPGHYQTRNGGTPTAVQHAQDFIALSKILDKYYPVSKSKSRPRMQGPDVCIGKGTNSSPCANITYFHTILETIGPNTIDEITAHTYGLRGPKKGMPPSFSQCHIDDFLNVSVFQSNVVGAVTKWLNVIQKVSPKLKLVISETATAADGGCVGLSNRFIAGFYFLQILGRLGDIGVYQVYRQNLIGFGGINFPSHYTLLNPPGWYNTKISGEITPNPDYFTSALYRKLVGPKRLKVVSENKLLHAACAVGGGIVITFINPTENLLDLNISLIHSVDSYNMMCHESSSAVKNRGDTTTSGIDGKVELYIMTAENLTSRVVKLNGVDLNMDSKFEYVYGNSNHVEIPPFSYGFIVQR
jgi:heparanase